MGAPSLAAVVIAMLPVHGVPMSAPRSSIAVQSANGAAPDCVDSRNQPAPCNVRYWGGHVISNVKIYAVFWSSSVDATTKSSIGGFFTALTNSDWMDWLNEYRTDVSPAGGGSGTGQLVGRGQFAGPAITIAPSASATCVGTSQVNPLQDSAIQLELVAQIDAGALPAPDANTLYMLYFPPGCVIGNGTSHSCASGGFCAYHGTLTRGGQSVFYGVVPDFGAGSGCDLGCGGGTPFENLCSATSHEVGEAITDPEVGLATVLGPPLGWYDPTNGETGDMCNAVQASIVSIADGTPYTVQQLYSAQTGLCQVTRTNPNDFKVFMNPNTAMLAAGGTIVVPVNTTLTAGSPPSLHLSLGPLPAGVTGSFDAVTLAAGAGTNLRLTASAAAPAASDAVAVVTACAGSGACPSPGILAHTASLLLQVSHKIPAVGLSVATSLSGTVPISASATPAAGTALATLSISVDGHQVATSARSPLTANWDTTQVLNGAHMVTATATDVDGGSASTQASVAVTNDFIIAVAPGRPVATIGGSSATFTVSTAAVGGLEPVALAVSGLPAGVQASLDQSTVTSGNSAILTVVAPAGVAPGRTTFAVSATTRSVPAGHRATAELLVVSQPSVALIAPAGGTVSGRVTITGTATVDANAGLARVDLKDGDALIGSGSTAALSASWDTTLVANGTHALTAVVVDGAGNLATSPVVSVVVANSSGGCSSRGASGLESLGLAAVLGAIRRRRSGAGRPSPR